ncbi:hypothetical protein U9M48_043769 [Paspalum notatum var. saurae]|uniref:Uncharacterized protein n=1 Tax=Paspalum notatum var. saurae TaxID=547442 RepID=A0AAQ3XGT4_PASNO
MMEAVAIAVGVPAAGRKCTKLEEKPAGHRVGFGHGRPLRLPCRRRRPSWRGTDVPGNPAPHARHLSISQQRRVTTRTACLLGQQEPGIASYKEKAGSFQHVKASLGFFSGLFGIAFAAFSTGEDYKSIQVRDRERSEDDVPYGYGFFHFVFATGSMYLGMVFVSWDTRDATVQMFNMWAYVVWTCTVIHIVNEGRPVVVSFVFRYQIPEPDIAPSIFDSVWKSMTSSSDDDVQAPAPRHHPVHITSSWCRNLQHKQQRRHHRPLNIFYTSTVPLPPRFLSCTRRAHSSGGGVLAADRSRCSSGYGSSWECKQYTVHV